MFIETKTYSQKLIANKHIKMTATEMPTIQ